MNNTHNTFLSYRNSYDNLIRIINDKQISTINKSDIEEFKSKRSKEVNLVSANIDIRNIKAMFNKMIEFDLMDQSRISTVKQFKIEKKKILAIDSVDVVRILNSIKDDQLRQIVRSTRLTVSRISEVLNIKIKDIDFVNKVVNFFQIKTNSFKTIPLTKGLSDLINEIMNFGNKKNIFNILNRESYLFYNKEKNSQDLKLRADTVSKQFKRVLKRLKLNEDFKFHSLRHTAITELIKNNVHLNIVKEIAGHTSITTTMIYSHDRSDDMKQAVNS